MILFGHGGHSKVVVDAVHKALPDEHFIFVDENNPMLFEHRNEQFFIAIGENSARERISKKDLNFNFNICHPCSMIQAETLIGIRGSFFAAFSYVGVNSKVGNFSIINSGVLLEHDSIVGDFTHLAPGVVTGGRVKIGSRTTIGLGCKIMDGVTIGSNVVVGMGSTVVCDIPDNTVWFNEDKATFRRVNK